MNIFSNKTGFDNETTAVPVSLQAQIVFYIFLLLDIPSVMCSLLLFYCFACLHELRQQYQSNQTIIYLLIGTFLVISVDIPLILPYLQNHYYIQFMMYPNSFCIFWIIYDYSVYSLSLWLMALFCLERYLLIFHKQLVMKNRKRRFCLYYVPVTLIILFVVCWYLYFVAFYPCQHMFDFTQVVCGAPCYQTTGSIILQNTNWVLMSLLPSFLTILFIFILISHLIYQRRKISKHLIQQDIWKYTRKMFLQLLPITFVFLSFNMPLIIVGFLGNINPWYYTTPYFYANYLTYCWPLCIPFAILSKQHVIHKRLFILLRFRRFNRTVPMQQTTQNMAAVIVKTINDH